MLTEDTAARIDQGLAALALAQIRGDAPAPGQVSAATVIVSGEVEGNINASARVELLETGIINGDVKAAVLTVAAGSRMRGQADFGWGDQGSGRK
jgi:hypothetical protein